MSRLRLVWKGNSARATRIPPSLFDSADLGRAYFPGTGIAYSIGIHAAVFVALVFISLFRSFPPPPLPSNQIAFVHPRIPKVLMYLPLLEPAAPRMLFAAPKSNSGPSPMAKARKTDTKGLSYPGPQRIVSDPPNPTNLIQTVLQPDLEKPPILVPPLPLPNIVQVADVTAALPPVALPPLERPKEDPPEMPKPVPESETPPAPEEPASAMVLPALELAAAARIEAPKLLLPPSIPPVLQAKPAARPLKMELPGQMKAKAPDPDPEPVPENKPLPVQSQMAESAKPATVPKTAEKAKEIPIDESSVATKGKQNLLSLTPMPASPKGPVAVPAGEARGRFVISPDPNLAVTEKDPGMKTGTRSATIDIAKEKPVASGEANASGASSSVPKANSSSTGSGAANGKKSSSGPGAAGPGSKAAAAGSSGAGGSSRSSASPGSGRRPFSGITIVGGDVDPGEIPNEAPVRRARRPLQTSYGLSIISTEDSGGGLPFVGVFSNEQIYTVYLDMRQSEMEDDPNWTLEFAVIPGSGSRAENPGSNKQGLILPFPVEKIKPVFPVDLVRRHLNKMMLVFAIIGTDGRMDQITIEQSPDNQLDDPVFQALRRWVFRPAQLNGETVAAKVLMGIPLWLPE
ncbi:MAG: energy transducer TonB [Acidobacteriota bacterium]|nr:energy transducer TonB [Acidobacteriota bacterium]